MPYVTYNNGLSVTWFGEEENHQLTGDEVILGNGLEPPTLDQIKVAFPGYVDPVGESAPTIDDIISVLSPEQKAQLSQKMSMK